MTDQKLYRKIDDSVCQEEPMFIRALTIWIFRRCLTHKLRKATNHFCTIALEGGSALLTRFATGSESRPEVQALHPHEEPSMTDCF